MARRERSGPSGEILIRRDWEESSSSHIEKEDSCKLTANKDGSIVLSEEYSVTNFIKSADSSSSKSQYSISAEELVKLIKKYGNQI